MNHLKPSPIFSDETKKRRRKKTQVIGVSVNPQRPYTVIRPTSYVSQTLRCKLDPPTELRLYVGVSLPKDQR